jgi:hypothetical protein
MKCAIILRRFRRFDEGTKPLVLDRSESVIIAEDIYNFVLFRKRMSLQNKPHFDLIQSPL